ncbi:hypothetical protein EJ03DRAFT_288873 [Teratosphaeria nubilosa]|uniref:LysM domain-containing protein n=1 Tax=Teratosphaeria nubilosa TaxID=161662 RepID=A0A6G1LHN6_9PEZI|nr:hypothetical protein EJ03DRAFT_288873 [Teratosphaeria nubilosa]
MLKSLITFFAHVVALQSAFLAQPTSASSATCDSSTLNTTTYLYPITETGTTIFEVANATGRGVCNIARHNLMVDAEIPFNAGQTIYIPPEVCDKDDTSCLLVKQNPTAECIYGGPRLYYTVLGDTYERIALYRLNITVESLMGTMGNGTSPTDVLQPKQFLKVPLCDPSQCVMQPFTFTYGVFKDLAEEYGTTPGQIQMLSPTYNYSTSLYTGATKPSFVLPKNCTALSSNVTIIT